MKQSLALIYTLYALTSYINTYFLGKILVLILELKASDVILFNLTLFKYLKTPMLKSTEERIKKIAGVLNNDSYIEASKISEKTGIPINLLRNPLNIMEKTIRNLDVRRDKFKYCVKDDRILLIDKTLEEIHEELQELGIEIEDDLTWAGVVKFYNTTTDNYVKIVSTPNKYRLIK